jgi:hypothetical protein
MGAGAAADTEKKNARGGGREGEDTHSVTVVDQRCRDVARSQMTGEKGCEGQLA